MWLDIPSVTFEAKINLILNKSKEGDNCKNWLQNCNNLHIL